MITKCPHCSATLECSQDPGALVDCVSCGKPFEAYPAKTLEARRVPIPPPASGKAQFLSTPPVPVWKDDGRMSWLIGGSGIIALALHAAGMHSIAVYVDAIAIWSVFWWVCQLIRSCAYRLKHIEELLGRRQ